MEQVLFSVPLKKLEPVIKNWLRDVLNESIPQQSEETNPKYDVEATAKYLGISKATVYSKNSRGELPGCKAPGSKRLFFFKSDLDAALRANRRKTNQEVEEDAHTYLKKKGGNNG